MLDDSTRVARNPDLVFADMDGETVLMDVESGAYFGISGVGCRYWELMAEPIAISDLVSVVCGDYDIDPIRCEADLMEFINELRANSLVSIA
jgi:hypothetical protein